MSWPWQAKFVGSLPGFYFSWCAFPVLTFLLRFPSSFPNSHPLHLSRFFEHSPLHWSCFSCFFEHSPLLKLPRTVFQGHLTPTVRATSLSLRLVLCFKRLRSFPPLLTLHPHCCLHLVLGMKHFFMWWYRFDFVVLIHACNLLCSPPKKPACWAYQPV